jgi:hypothetical protein
MAITPSNHQCRSTGGQPATGGAHLVQIRPSRGGQSSATTPRGHGAVRTGEHRSRREEAAVVSREQNAVSSREQNQSAITHRNVKPEGLNVY